MNIKAIICLSLGLLAAVPAVSAMRAQKSPNAGRVALISGGCDFGADVYHCPTPERTGRYVVAVWRKWMKDFMDREFVPQGNLLEYFVQNGEAVFQRTLFDRNFFDYAKFVEARRAMCGRRCALIFLENDGLYFDDRSGVIRDAVKQISQDLVSLKSKRFFER